jgi:CheY-like chemotaxis protein
LQGLRVLLIDDNEIDLFFHDKLIKYQGISEDIVSFTAAQPALEYLADYKNSTDIPPTLILLDIQMPEMDGFDFIRVFETLPPGTKSLCHIVMVSSSLDFGDISKANANPLIIRLLKKPLNIKELKEIVDNIP